MGLLSGSSLEPADDALGKHRGQKERGTFEPPPLPPPLSTLCSSKRNSPASHQQMKLQVFLNRFFYKLLLPLNSFSQDLEAALRTDIGTVWDEVLFQIVVSENTPGEKREQKKGRGIAVVLLRHQMKAAGPSDFHPTADFRQQYKENGRWKSRPKPTVELFLVSNWQSWKSPQ